LGDRKEFMGEYGKVVVKLIRKAKAGSRQQGEDRDIPLENGRSRLGGLSKKEHARCKVNIAVENDEKNSIIAVNGYRFDNSR